jgi:hypothetical protein
MALRRTLPYTPHIIAMAPKPPSHKIALLKKLALFLILLLTTAAVVYAVRLSHQPEQQGESQALAETLSGGFQGHVYARSWSGYGLAYVGSPNNALVFVVPGRWFSCHIRQAVMALSLLVALSFAAWFGLRCFWRVGQRRS